VIARVRGRSEAWVGSTPPSPSAAAACLAALDVLQREPERLQRLHANGVVLRGIGERLGIGVRLDGVAHPSSFPALALPVQDAADGARLEAGLRSRGLFAAHVNYPGAPQAGVLRLVVNAEHGAADLRRLERALAELYPGGKS
jgi:8-amino-7-oxononanoate synthase